MFLTPYDTTALKRLQMDKVIREVERARIQNALNADIKDIPNTLALLLKSPETNTIPQFNQTVVLEDGTTVIDLRPYKNEVLRFIELDKSIPVGPARVLIDQAALQTIWQTGVDGRLALASLTNLPLYTYSHWLGESINRVLNLTPEYQTDVIIRCAWMWTCLFHESIDTSEDMVYRYASKIAQITYAKLETVVEMIREAGPINNLEQLVESVKGLPSARTDKLNTAIVITAVSGSWFGSSGAREQAVAALEHPPTFLAILANALQGAFYRKSSFFDIAKRQDKRGKFEEFTTAYAGVLRRGA